MWCTWLKFLCLTWKYLGEVPRKDRTHENVLNGRDQEEDSPPPPRTESKFRLSGKGNQGRQFLLLPGPAWTIEVLGLEDKDKSNEGVWCVPPTPSVNRSQFGGPFLETIASDLNQLWFSLNWLQRWLTHLHHACVCTDLALGSRKKNWMGGCGFFKNK